MSVATASPTPFADLPTGRHWQIVYVAPNGATSILAPCLDGVEATGFVATYNAEVVPLRGGHAEAREHYANGYKFRRRVLPKARRPRGGKS